MATTYSLLIDQKELNTKAISVVRKNLGLAMGEIRRRVAAGEPVHQCEAIDNDGIALIVLVHRELEAAGAEGHVLRGGREVCVAHLENVLRERRKDVVSDGEEGLFEDELWWSLDLG